MPFEKGNIPHNFVDLTGMRFGKLYVESYAGKRGTQNAWNCICDCGNKTIVTSNALSKGHTKSCGCLRKKNKGKFEDITGYENEDIIVISMFGKKNGKIYWNCKCKHCGKINQSLKGNIKKGEATCKCIHNKRIGQSNSKPGRNTEIYSKWIGMKNRCFNQNEKSYKNYGGRGITVCEEWLGEYGFDRFYEWSTKIGGYRKGYSIERIDVNGDYCPENCCWIPLKDQAKNKRNTLYIEINGESKRLKEWCEIYGANYKMVHQRIYRYGMAPLQALTYTRKESQ